MIVINKLEILNEGRSLAIDVQTTVGYKITSLLFWSSEDFKDYNLSIDLTGKLEQINNKEVLIIPVKDLGIDKIEDICFIEVESNAPNTSECVDCSKPVLGIAYELSNYYRCLIHYLLESDSNNCLTCEMSSDKNFDLSVAVNLLIDSVSKAIEAGFYQQAINMLKDLKSICDFKNCNGCEVIECNTCSNFKQQ